MVCSAPRRITSNRCSIFRRKAESFTELDATWHNARCTNQAKTVSILVVGARAEAMARLVLSQVISRAYILSMSGNFVMSPPAPHFGILFTRAVDIEQAISDPIV